MSKQNKQQILEKAIQKAIDGGYDKQYAQEILDLLDEGADHEAFVRGVVFHQEFAKALWSGIRPENGFGQVEDWQYHLKQMVIAEDPIKYLGENL